MAGRFGTVFKDVKPVQGFMARTAGRQGRIMPDPLMISGSTDPEGQRLKRRLRVKKGN